MPNSRVGIDDGRGLVIVFHGLWMPSSSARWGQLPRDITLLVLAAATSTKSRRGSAVECAGHRYWWLVPVPAVCDAFTLYEKPQFVG